MPLNKKELLVKLGSRIKEEREANGMTQQELAARCNFEKSNMSRLESGNTKPTFTKFLKIFQNLNISPSKLL